MTFEPPTDVRSDALRLLSGGLFVLTSCDDDAIHAAAVSWVSQVSSQPVLVLVALRRNSHLAQAVRSSHRFALNILGREQQDIAGRFLSHQVLSVTDEDLAGEAFRMSPSKCPLLTDTLAWLECRFAAEPSSPGDHCLILGEVTSAGVRREGRTLTLWDTPWSYGGTLTGEQLGFPG
jgi:flavin reductase (DIM6/NTAB) family NADH-FMN oxidoreductase RutF